MLNFTSSRLNYSIAVAFAFQLGCAQVQVPTPDLSDPELTQSVVEESRAALCEQIADCELENDNNFDCSDSEISGIPECQLAKANYWDCLSERSCEDLDTQPWEDLCSDEYAVYQDTCWVKPPVDPPVFEPPIIVEPVPPFDPPIIIDPVPPIILEPILQIEPLVVLQP